MRIKKKYLLAYMFCCAAWGQCYGHEIEWEADASETNHANWFGGDIEADQRLSESVNEIEHRISEIKSIQVQNNIAIMDIANNLGEITRSVQSISTALSSLSSSIVWYFDLIKTQIEKSQTEIQ